MSAQNQADTTSLRRQRIGLGLTLVDLAELCASHGVAVHPDHLSKIERGVHPPRPHLRAALARVLELRPDQVDASGAA
ncbi:helix-turn-helix domain-containing protein [Streptomyces albipurpureus]|uniref:helix-turn-helix domain-containing protein n=1 Tax=Streptomyces albipurpureus TaxID=2897419 RepID=UPI003CE4A7FA